MKGVAGDLVAICRSFGVFERAGVCCGTVTVPQCVALQALLDGEREVSDLAAAVGITTSAMTRLADGLEAKGWVERTRSGDDRRRVSLSLGPAGREEALRLRDRTEEAIEAILGRIPRARRRQVVESLRLVREAIEAARSDLWSCCGGPPEDG